MLTSDIAIVDCHVFRVGVTMTGSGTLVTIGHQASTRLLGTTRATLIDNVAHVTPNSPEISQTIASVSSQKLASRPYWPLKKIDRYGNGRKKN